MPQMAPLKWLNLFFVFLLTFLMFNILNYFTFSLKKNNSSFNIIKNKNIFLWKW